MVSDKARASPVVVIFPDGSEISCPRFWGAPAVSDSRHHFDGAGIWPRVVMSSPAARRSADEPRVLMLAGGGREPQRPVPWLPSLHQRHARRRRCRSLPALHLTIFDVALHQKNGARWARLPSKPMARRPRRHRRGDWETGIQPVIEFEGPETRDAFSEAVWQRL
jgi:hypothetical protein